MRARIAAAARLAAYACAAYIAATTSIFAWRGSLFVATADAWGFVATFLARYYDGTLTLADFFAKRNGLDHAQPLQKLLFLAYARFLDLDFTYETATGLVFGVAFIAVIVWIVRADTKGEPLARPVVALTTLGITAVVLTLNDEGVFDWSLATLSLFYPLGVALMLAFAHRCITRDAPLRLAAATLVACLLLDTSAILAAAAIVALIALRRRTFATPRTPLRLAAAIAVVVVAYVVGYALAFPDVEPGGLAIGARLGILVVHAGDAWKAIVIPLGAVIASPHRIKVMHGVGAFWTWLVPAALLVAAGHVWFWREIVRRDDSRLAFVAAGLMLFFYATLVGILWGRVPRYGFDYFMQSRYLVFYMLQLVAMLMLAASNAARSERSADPFAAYAAAVVVLASAAIVYGRSLDIPANVNFNGMLDAKAIALAEHPEHPPADCPVNHLTLCNWEPHVRIATLDLMRREELNVFSPRFRERHELPPLPHSLQAPPGAR
ncbi:MAG TPA: hypothetical protein VFV97_16385 [Rhodanobacteraceae bacterium]|nr:hypothetical protein [Rhodanobacteraceae bacterium]